MIVRNFQEVNLKVFLGALRRWPIFAIKILIPFLSLTGVSALELMNLKDLEITKSTVQTTQEV
jgi:hypothetical protein